MDKQYKYRENFRGSVPAQAFGEVLDDLEDKLGKVEAQDVVDAARPDESPIHNLCSWDDAEEAEKYRQHVARKHIRATVEITVVKSERQTKPQEIAISERVHSKDGGYKRIEVVAADPLDFSTCMHEFQTKVASLRASMRRLEEVAEARLPDNEKGMIVLSKAFDMMDEALDMLH
jgi:hypothetical protein